MPEKSLRLVYGTFSLAIPSLDSSFVVFETQGSTLQRRPLCLATE